MEALATAAEALADAPTVAAEAADAAPAPAPKTKRTKIEVKASALDSAKLKLESLRAAAKVAQLATQKGGAATLAARQAKAEAAEVKVKQQGSMVAAIEKELNTLSAAAAIKEAAAAQKTADAQAKADAVKVMSDEGIQTLVTIRIGYTSKFDNKTDRNENVWEHVAKDFNAKVDDGSLPAGDRRGADSLKAKYAKEFGIFKLYVAHIGRMKASGASGDEIENSTKHKTAATSIFWKHEVQNRPATVPPHAINGGNASRGGEANPFRRGPGEWADSTVEGLSSDDEAGGEDDDGDGDAAGGADAAGGDAAGGDEAGGDEAGGDEAGGDEARATPAPAAPKRKGSAATEPKPMNIGGGADAKYRPPRKKKKGDQKGDQMAELITYFKESEDAAVMRDEAAAKAAEAERDKERQHELKMVEKGCPVQ